MSGVGGGRESFPDKGNSKHKSPEIRKTVGYSGNCQRSVSLVENGVRWGGGGAWGGSVGGGGHGPDYLGLCRPRKGVGFHSKFKGKPLRLLGSKWHDLCFQNIALVAVWRTDCKWARMGVSSWVFQAREHGGLEQRLATEMKNNGLILEVGWKGLERDFYVEVEGKGESRNPLEFGVWIK